MSTQAQLSAALRAKRAGAGLAVAGFALVVLSFVYGLMAYQRIGGAISLLMPSTPGLLACAGTSAGLALCFVGLGKVGSVTTTSFIAKTWLITGIVWALGAVGYVLTLASRLLGLQ